MPAAPSDQDLPGSYPGRVNASRIAALGVGLVVALLLAEASLRVFGLAPARGLITVSAADFERLPGIFAPSQDFTARQISALPYQIRIDDQGFRVTDATRQAPAAGAPLILYVGDSFTFGDFVDDRETLPAQFEQSLAAHCPAIRVVNAGLGGTTIVDHLHILARTLPLEPDLVILQFSENDVEDLARPTSAWDQLAANRQAKSKFPFSAFYPYLSRTALWNAALQFMGAARTRQVSHAMHPPTAEQQDSLRTVLRDRYRDGLYAFRDSTAARSVPLVFVMYPGHASVTAGRSEQLTWLEKIATQGWLTTVDLLYPLAQSGLPDTTLFLLPHDGHPSATGYRIAAQFLASALWKNPSVRGRCPTADRN